VRPNCTIGAIQPIDGAIDKEILVKILMHNEEIYSDRNFL
jgi:hypothetical protein